MKRELIVEDRIGEMRSVLVEDGRAVEIFIERRIGGLAAADQPAGTLVLGRVKAVKPGAGGAFLDIGTGADAFLGTDDAQSLYDGKEADPDTVHPINTCVREGDLLIVMIKREAVGGKGPRVTADVTVPGDLLVFMPRRPRVAVSRSITDQDVRAELVSVLKDSAGEGAGFIARTAAAGADREALLKEADALKDRWRDINRHVMRGAKPGPLSDTDHPAVFGHVAVAELSRIVVSGEAAFKRLRSVLSEIYPAMTDLLERHQGAGRIFEAEGLADDMERTAKPVVPLPSGGWLRIDPTEAMTVVDINAGRAAEGGSHGTVNLNLALEAAEEIARQLRLRAIGGLIVIDFPDLGREDESRVEEALAQAMAHDPAPHRIGQFGDFGLLALTRQRTRRPLDEYLHAPRSDRASLEAVALSAVEAAVTQLERAPQMPVRLEAPPDLAAWLEPHQAALAREAGARVRQSFEVVADPGRAPGTYGIVTAD